MARVLLAWELGANLGHLVPLALLSRALEAAGHDTAFAVRALHRTHEVFTAPEHARLFAAPLPPSGADAAPVVQHSHAHLLWASGFAEADPLANRLVVWQNLFRAANVDLVVAKHAPTAALAARLAGLPVVLVGSGFQVPVLTDPLPAYRPWLNLTPDALRDLDGAVLGVIQQAFRRLGAAPPPTLVAALTPTAQRLLTIRELDHYRDRPAGESFWRCLNEVAGDRPAAFERPHPKAMLYLAPGYRLNAAIVRALIARGLAVHVYGVGTGEAAAALAALGARVHVRPIDLPWALARSDLLVCHGGTATIELGLRFGVPQLLCPTHIEQYMVSMRAHDLGVADVLVAEQADADPVACLERLLGATAAREAAGAVARQFGPESLDETLARLAVSIAACR